MLSRIYAIIMKFNTTRTKMNKTITTLSLAALMALSFAGCSNKELSIAEQNSAAECNIDGAIAPKWVCGMQTMDNEIIGMGSHPRGKASIDFVISQSQLSGRAKLATQIETQVKTATKNFIQTTGIDSGQTVDDVAQRTSKEVASVTLTGSRQVSFWQHPQSKDIYVLMAVPTKIVADKTKEIIKSTHADKNALWQQAQAERAFKQLDEDIAAH